MFPEDVKDFLEYLLVFRKVLGEDQDVVNVDADDSATDEVLENVIHHRLKGGQTIGETI